MYTDLLAGVFGTLGAVLFFIFSIFILIISSLVIPSFVSEEEVFSLEDFTSTVFKRKSIINITVWVGYKVILLNYQVRPKRFNSNLQPKTSGTEDRHSKSKNMTTCN